MFKIIFYGIGGQGVITASKMLASAAIFHEDRYATVAVKYGTQRRGGVVRSFIRINDDPIHEKCLIYKADCVAVSHPAIINRLDFNKELNKNGIAVLNNSNEKDIRDLDDLSKIGIIDANEIAEEVWGESPILLTSMPMLGAICATTDILKLNSVISVIRQKWSGKLGDLNIEAVDKGYNKTKVMEHSLVKNGNKLGVTKEKNVLTGEKRPIINVGKCTKCGMCWMHCPENAIIKQEDGSYKVDSKNCKNCGICIEECPLEAISETKKYFEE